MKLDGTYTFDAPRTMVFEMLQDPEVLAKIIPGCEELKLIGDNEYEAVLDISVGPVKSQFKGKVSLADLNPPESYTMHIDGKGAAGFVKGVGHVKLTEQETATLMSYEGDAQVGGRIVSVGQRLLDSAAKSLTRQSLDNVNKFILASIEAQKAPTTIAEAAPPPIEFKAPSQVEFATGVAKGVIEDLVPPDRRPLLIAGGVGLMLLIVFLLIRGRGKD